MRLELTARHIDIAPTVRRLVERKLARLERMFNDSALSAQVVLSREKRIYRAEVSLHARGEKFLHGVGESAAWDPSVSQAIDKIVKQASKVKGKWQERKRSGRLAVPDDAAVERSQPQPRRPREPRPAPRMPRVLQTSRQTLISMSLSEATRQIEAKADRLVVYRDAQTALVSVLYKRANGELTLIETDV
jgi:putative sigma-54 modulation protein